MDRSVFSFFDCVGGCIFDWKCGHIDGSMFGQVDVGMDTVGWCG